MTRLLTGVWHATCLYMVCGKTTPPDRRKAEVYIPQSGQVVLAPLPAGWRARWSALGWETGRERDRFGRVGIPRKGCRGVVTVTVMTTCCVSVKEQIEEWHRSGKVLERDHSDCTKNT